ncbi:hydantoinase/oxoprolinase family protein [Thermosulfuriphilus sp.]
MIEVAVDTGGTFTDFVLREGEHLITLKLPSTPADPSRAILKGLRNLLTASGQSFTLFHGTTVATNAFLERKGARVVMITTRGFEDVVFIGRQARPKLYDFFVQKPTPIVARRRIIGVSERVSADGSVIHGLPSYEKRRIKAFIARERAESVAICLLHSYVNPSHERQIAQWLDDLGLPVCLSSEILPEFREYERFSTTLINAYLAPVMIRYLKRLAERLSQGRIFVVQSNGGLLPVEVAGRQAVRTILSGPAAGVMGAQALAQALGLEKIITFDMGGTSTDVSLVSGQPIFTRDYQIDGFPVALPLIDIHTVGAGGGSVARVDKGGALKVGPKSAGAEPGPACYGRGGQEATVTDANVLLGRLPPEYFLSGQMPLDSQAALRAIGTLAARVGLSPAHAALGIIRVVNTNMSRALRAVSLERGYDPREFVLFCYGGAGALHAAELAAELGIRRVVIPAMAGVLSALGMLATSPMFDYSQTVFLSGEELLYPRVAALVEELARRGLKEVERIGFSRKELVVEAAVDLRYQGQSFELTVAFDEDFIQRFEETHQRLYGYRLSKHPLELTAIRCRLRVVAHAFVPPAWSATGEAFLGKTKTFGQDGWQETDILAWKGLNPGFGGQGPTVIISDYTTCYVPKGVGFSLDTFGNLWLEIP